MVIKWILLAIVGVYIVLLTFFSYQIYYLSHGVLPVQVDAIIVVTGQGGRIEAGEQLLQKYHCPLLISGVGQQVPVQDIIKNDALTSRVILGHFAKNTAENGQEIQEWVHSYHLQSVIVISHNYHLPRLLLYLEKIPNLKIYPYSVTAYLSTARFLAEMHKYYYSLLSLKLNKLII